MTQRKTLHINYSFITHVGDGHGVIYAKSLLVFIDLLNWKTYDDTNPSVTQVVVLVPVISVAELPERDPHIYSRLHCNISGSFLLFIGSEEGLWGALAEDIDKSSSSLYRGNAS